MIIDEAYIRENLLSQTDSNGADLKLIANNKTAQKAFNKIERLIRVRDRAVSEVEARLIQDEYPQEAINEAIERALMCGYLDDLRFTEVFIRTRIEAGKGLSGIIRDLKRLQIDPYTLEGFPYQYLPENYEAIDSALNVLLKNLHEPKINRKLLMPNLFGKDMLLQMQARQYNDGLILHMKLILAVKQ